MFFLWLNKTYQGSARAELRPTNWFLLFSFAFFVMPLIAVLLTRNQVPGLGYMSSIAASPHALSVLIALNVFFYTVCFSFVLFRGRVPHINAILIPPTKFDIQISLAMLFVGTAASLALGSGYSGDVPRSSLVQTASGRLLYALTFLQSAGFIVSGFYMAVNKQYYRLMLLVIVFVVPLFFLGGRGRILWPLVIIYCVTLIYRNKSVYNWKALAFSSCIILSLLMMDPLLAWFYSSAGGIVAPSDLRAVVYDMYITRRNFDGFYNFFVIFDYDEIPHSLSYVFTGVRDVFMLTYFPDVYARGFGFPATVPGTFWIVAGYTGLLIGAACYGVLLARLDYIYFKIKDSIAMSLLLYLVVMVGNPGGSIVDSVSKLAVLILSFTPYIASRVRARWRPST